MVRTQSQIAGLNLTTGFVMWVLSTVVTVMLVQPSRLLSQEFLIDNGNSSCDNQGPGSESRPWCNLYGLDGHRFEPGSTVSIKAGDYIGDEDPDDRYEYHNGITIDGQGASDQPFTIRAWPGDEGNVRIFSASRSAGSAFVFRGSHIRLKGLTFIGHIDLPDRGRLYSPRLIRFSVTTGPVNDIVFDGVRVLHFQGADDVGLGCRWTDLPPEGQCDLQRKPEGWGRGIDIAGVRNLVFENGEVTCTDEAGKIGLEEVRARGLYLGADGVKSEDGCSGITFRNNVFFACGHNDLMFTRCDSVLVENNYFENELHRSVGFTEGGNHTVRYNSFAAWEKRRVNLLNGGGNAIQFRTSNSRVHHNLFYGGGEPRHQGAINLSGLEDFVVRNNEIFNNVILGLNSMSFNLNDKFDEPFNVQNNRIYNNIFIGRDTEQGVFNWGSAMRESYLAGQTFGNEIRNNIFYSLSDDPELVSTLKFRAPIEMSEDEFNALAVASGNIFGDPGLADVNFEAPDFRLQTTCIAIKAGIPIDVLYDFDGNLIEIEGSNPSIGAYVADFDRLAAPTPVYPADSATGTRAYTTFYWGEVEDAENYHLQVSDDSSFSAPLVDIDGLRSTLYFAQTPLPYSSTFFWRVRLSAAGGKTYPESADCTLWSRPQAFTIAVGTAAEEVFDLPTAYQLSSNYPNPFTGTTTITYDLPVPSLVNLTVFDALGREVLVLVDGWKQAGRQSVQWETRSLISGTYFYRLQAGDYAETKALLLER